MTKIIAWLDLPGISILVDYIYLQVSPCYDTITMD